MTTSKFKRILIEPLITGSRVISGDHLGNMILSDVGSTLSLRDMANLSTIDNVYVVGPSGSGAGYNKISDAISDVNGANRSIILVFPGLYGEDILINKNNVSIIGLGDVLIEQETNSDTITVEFSVSSTPRNLLLSGLTIVNSRVNKSCLRVNGVSGTNLLSEGLSLFNCKFLSGLVGSNFIVGDIFNKIKINSCEFGGSPNSSIFINQCPDVLIRNSELDGNIQLVYVNSGQKPSNPYTGCNISGVMVSGDCIVEYDGELDIGSSACRNMLVVGGGPVSIINSKFSSINISGSGVTMSNVLKNSVFGSGTYTEDKIIGSVIFTASSSETYTFDVENSDSNYTVFVENTDDQCWVSNKQTAGFTLNFSAPKNTVVHFMVVR